MAVVRVTCFRLVAHAPAYLPQKVAAAELILSIVKYASKGITASQTLFSMANMSTAAGVGALLREIYRFFISIGYTTEDTVHFPPHPPEVFQEAAYKANDLDENAINTLRFIPSPKSFPGRGEVELFYRAQPPCHGIPDFFGETRHPILPEFDVEEDFHDHLPPYMITLAFGKYEEGQTIVLDAQNSKATSL